jgi:hypothetical protein
MEIIHDRVPDDFIPSMRSSHRKLRHRSWSDITIVVAQSAINVGKSSGSVKYSNRSTEVVNAGIPISKDAYTDSLVQGKDIQGPQETCNNRSIPDRGSVMPFPSDTIGPERNR